MVRSQFAFDGIKNSLSLERLFAWHGLGVLLLLVLPSLVAWQGRTFGYLAIAWPMMVLVCLAYLFSLVVSYNLWGYPRTTTFWLVFSCLTLGFFGAVSIVAFGRLYYSRSFLLSAYAFSYCWLVLGYHWSLTTKQLTLALIPGGMAEELKNLPDACWQLLQGPRERLGIVEGVVVDLHQRLSAEWVHFISNCALKRLPVYHAAVVFEALTGRVSLSHLSEGVLEDFRLPPLYTHAKRMGDVLLVLMLIPLVLLVLLVATIAIRLDSPGPVFFWQERVGEGGKTFRMLKLRSMYVDVISARARFASEEKKRISRVGAVLRHFRIDELPQIWNVIRGEMSFIGPRPEQIPFVRKFEQEIPYYSYRHLVKPGLTGWAQVSQGYAAGVDETRCKLEYDLYYIKYLSFWLDIGILGRTLRTVMSGFGAC